MSACPKTRVGIVAAALFISKRSETPQVPIRRTERAGEESRSECTEQSNARAAGCATSGGRTQAPREIEAKGHARQTNSLCLRAVPGLSETQNGGHHQGAVPGKGQEAIPGLAVVNIFTKEVVIRVWTDDSLISGWATSFERSSAN